MNFPASLNKKERLPALIAAITELKCRQRPINLLEKGLNKAVEKFMAGK
jgi:hypothetical protein